MTPTDIRVKLSKAVEPFVLAIDIGSTASRGDVYDATGRSLRGGRVKVPHQFTSRSDGTSEIDPDAVVVEVEQIITAFANRPFAGRVQAVALDTFASSLVGVGEDRRAWTPCFTYADSRCANQVVQLRRELDEMEIQQRTGCRLHTSYLTPRLRWLRDTAPDTFAAVRQWMSLGEYVYLQLLGVTAAGTSTAAWTGMLDRRTGRWDPELLARTWGSGRSGHDEAGDAAGYCADRVEVRAPGVASADPIIGETRWPIHDRAPYYATRKRDFEHLYEALIADD